MKKKKYLPLYEKWMKTGQLPECGLCNCFGECITDDEYFLDPSHQLFKLMYPEDIEMPQSEYWGRGPIEELVDIEKIHNEFTPLRQNIVLLMAAMNGEL